MKKIRFAAFIVATFLCLPLTVFSQDKKEDKDKEKTKTVADLTKSATKIEGLFTLYQDTVSGKVHIYLKKDQLDKEFIYQSFSMGGPPSLFLNQNMIRATWVFKTKKNFDRISWIKSNTNYYYDPENPISKSANVDVSESNFYTTKILAEDDKGYLIAGDDLLLSERMDPIKPFMAPKTPPESYLNLGSLKKDNSGYLSIKSYPGNTNILVNLSYENGKPVNFGGKDITDARYIDVKMQHSFIAMPENNYQPRRDDPRVGYFMQQKDDMTRLTGPPFRDYINRWHLEKKNPEAEVSDPVDPIVWWVENTTPEEYRDIIVAAGLKWNEAFEKAGFSNAVEMKIMPDDADWDPEDIRYNVIRWVSSGLGFAIGPSFVNPRTGQILGADITIDYNMMSGVMNQSEIFEATESDALPQTQHMCAIGKGLQMQYQAGLTFLEAMNLDDTDKGRLTEEFLTMLVLHEMGHTLGLNHNMKSSQMLSPEELRDHSITGELGVTGSVMDYASINVSLDREEQGHYYTTKTGPYDWWAIEYGYTSFVAENEKEGLKTILSRSTEPNLIFGNDADIAGPGSGIDPRVQVWDMSSDMPAYAEERFQLVNSVIPDLKDRILKPDLPYTQLLVKVNSMMGQRRIMSRALSRYIGGIEVDRSFPGQNSDNRPLQPLSMKEQKRAMDVLGTYVFAPDAFEAEKELYPYLQRQRRGFNFFGNTEDPKISAYPLRMQKEVLDFILHPVTMERIENTGLYGNEYTTEMVISDLIDHCFKADMKSDVNLFRRNLQVELVDELTTIFNDKKDKYSSTSKAASFKGLNTLKENLSNNRSGDKTTQAHREYLVFKINEAMEVD